MNLKIKFLPYEKIKNLNGILKELQKDTIIMIDAKLSVEEETEIIKETMKRISKKFTGVELSSLSLSDYEKEGTILRRVRNKFVEKLIGKKRGITVVGPAKIIKKIKKNPEELLLDMSG
jgi:hypothetical protein